MTNYEYFLKNCNVITEELFNEVVDSLPECDIQSVNFVYDLYDNLDSQDLISEVIINYIIKDYDYVFSEDVCFEDKKFTLSDCESLNDLEAIKELFETKGWKIANYEDIKEDIIKMKEEEDSEIKKRSLFNSIISDVTLEELKEFANGIKKRHSI